MAFALVGGTVLDGTGADPVPNATVVVDGERIAPVVWMKELSTAAAIRAARIAKRMLLSGITSFRDAGTVGYVSLGLKQAVEAGTVPGPTIVACGNYISMTGRDS